jgi:asparagine synthase (glutamine-hydrolysing)
MCGIAGIVGERDPSRAAQRCNAMQPAIRHRGPDDEGIYLDDSGALGLVHTRLAILDLSAAGHQPMHTGDKRYTIVFNGEIYNYKQLRAELAAEGVHFHSDSDTEVLLQLYARGGHAMLEKLQGMFAFAIWDRDNRTLFLARDPLGIKQLYYWEIDGKLAFASELRGVLAADLGPRTVDRKALARFLLMGSVQEPDTLVDGILQLPAGCHLTWSAGQTRLVNYWNQQYLGTVADVAEAALDIRSALDDSIRRHFVSDVPVGIFLSGGIDSTAVVALAKANGFSDLKTFCISFGEQEFNEGDISAQSSKHFRTDHYDWRMTADDGRSLLDGFLNSLDLPSNDGFNTYCVSKLAHDQGMKVVLSGLGGDELFGGYPSFRRVPQLMHWHKLARWAGPLRQLTANLLRTSNRAQVQRIAAFLKSSGGAYAAYWTTRAFFTPDEATQLVADLSGRKADFDFSELLDDRCLLASNPQNAVAQLESTLYMRNQLLRDSDVMSMAHGLELRVPLVDWKLSEAVGRISPKLRYRSNKQQLLDAVPEVPRWVSERPKRGFRFPFEQWVQQQWSSEFDAVQSRTAVRLGSWYRKWTLVTLAKFLQKNVICFN